ncbi:hypothetical protein G9A89_021019 [Geosiphon pyriformis]|nr:hypothetical protein G9A89_021019 [Geosiphon pyriformis]
MIKSILDKPFCKVVFDYLIVDDKLVLDPVEVKSKYASLQHVNNSTFSDIIDVIGFDELFQVVKHLLDEKTTGLSSILNKLWKHCGNAILKSLLSLLNLYLRLGTPYNWDSVLINTYSIALVETARKILSKIFLNWISLTCSKFGVLCRNNFFILKDTSMQTPIFAVGLMVEDALEKVKRQESVCGYWIDTKFVAKTGRISNISEMTSFFTVRAFVDNTIWVGSNQAALQFILDIASNFYLINNISINNDKTIAIPINQRVKDVVLKISGSLISIAKHGVPHRYLGIFLSTSHLSKPSLAKVQSDIKFFSNMVLQKAIFNKQFLYLVSAVFQPIVDYHTQFSFVSSAVCYYWDALVKKSFKSKAGLSWDFPNEVLYYFSLYGFKTFDQI